MSAAGTHRTQGKPKSQLLQGRECEGGCLSEDVSIQGAGWGQAPLCLDSLLSGGRDPARDPFTGESLFPAAPWAGWGHGGSHRLEDAADQAPGGRPGCTGPGLRQRQQICWGGMGEGRMELAGGVPLQWAWGTHCARVGSSRHSPLEAVWPCWHRGDI